MKVEISKVKKKLLDAIQKESLTLKEAEVIADQYLDAELRGKKSHGLGKFCVEFQYFKDRVSKPKIIKEKGPVALVDANREIGQLSAAFCVNLVIKKAKKYGVSVIGMFNTQRYGILGTWVRKIAEKDLVGLVVNSCEPATTVYGGISPIMGTNPLAFAVPTLNKPIVLDMATSKHAMSTVWQARREKTLLLKKSYLDKEGNYTIKPEDVFAAEHFGGYKGFGINLMIEIISGSLVRAKMGLDIKSFYDIGYYFQAIDPSMFQPIETFKRQNTQLIRQIKKSKRKKGFKKIYLPGERSDNLKQRNIRNGYVQILDETWHELNRLTI